MQAQNPNASARLVELPVVWVGLHREAILAARKAGEKWSPNVAANVCDVVGRGPTEYRVLPSARRLENHQELMDYLMALRLVGSVVTFA